LKNINLEIKKGSTIGIIGETGSGKSTLVDIIMAFLSPKNGSLEVDGKIINKDNINSWRSLISHVPQSIFLFDSSIAENIALNVSKENIDYKLLTQVIKQAQLFELIEGWSNKLNTVIGERGIRLSGGQRQRIGIARALYKKSEVILFDEATSALDSKTEILVMNEINKLEITPTVIIVAHRHSTLENCDQIIEVKNGKLKSYGSYENFKKIY
jgi:ATP-binding cassette, subfamily B, bacterial PglK